MQVSVIIVNYNTIKLTSQCIASLLQCTTNLDYEIIVVDNGSTEPGISVLKEQFPSITLLISDTNLGFSGGNNLGIAKARGEYILLLNSDTYLQQNALFTAYQYMVNHPKAGVVSLRLIYPDGRHQSVAQRLPSIRYTLIELLRLQKLMKAEKAGRLLLGSFFDHKTNVIADWVWGTFFMFRRSILDRLPDHKLDETYFMYNEDMQWCIDIRKLGFEIHYCAEAEVVHLLGGSSGKKNVMMEENGHKFMKRNYSWWHRSIIKILKSLL